MLIYDLLLFILPELYTEVYGSSRIKGNNLYMSMAKYFTVINYQILQNFEVLLLFYSKYFISFYYLYMHRLIITILTVNMRLDGLYSFQLKLAGLCIVGY